MKIEVGILEAEWEAITWMDTVKKIMNDVTEDSGVLNALEDVCSLLDRIYEVAGNEQIIQKDKIRARENS